MSNVCEHGQLHRVCLICEQADEIKRLTAERDAWRKLVMEHNAWRRPIIDIPPELEQP